MRACLDTDVLVKCLRGIPSALDWLNSHPAEDMFVPGIAAMELAAGCRNKIELKQVQRLLKDFEVVWPDAQDSQRAYELLIAYRLSFGLGIPDALIAAIVLNRSATLYTFNLRHFQAIAGLAAKRPYARTPDTADG